MKGFVYRIYDNTNGNIYYGSTKERNVSNRICKHRSSYKGWLKGCKGEYFCSSYDILKNGNYSYNIVEEVEFENKYELKNRERYYIENNECVNKYIPNRTVKEYGKKYREDNKNKILEKQKEYYEENKDKKKEYDKEYRENNKERYKEYQKEYRGENKDKIKEYNKKWRENNKDKKKEYNKEWRENNKDNIKEYQKNNKEKILECNKKYRENNKEKIKKFYEDNKNKILEKQKEYYEENKDKILEKITCECGCVVCKICLKRHKKSKKHLKLISTK